MISVIVPIYKVEKYLDECIQSIVNQTYTDLQIILIDDGSPDNSGVKCDEWKLKDNRIEVIHKENGGLSDARNAGLEVAKGEYFYFADSDDYLDVTMLDTMYRFLTKKHCDIVMCNKAIVWANEIEYELNDGTEVFFEGEEILDNYLYHRYNFCSGVWNKLFNAELFEGIKYPMGINSEDYFVYSIVYSRAKRMGCISKALYYYRQRQGSICNTTINEQSFCKIEIARLVRENLEKVGCKNKKGINNFNMQAHKDVLNDLIRGNASKKLIKEYTKKFRRFFFGILFDKKINIKAKMKTLTFLIMPRCYTTLKKRFVYDGKDENMGRKLFE